MLRKDTLLYSHQIYNSQKTDVVVGRVTQNPKNPTLWGIRNESEMTWTYIKPDGKHIPVPIGKNASIARGVKIDFGGIIGEFK
jgi:hypothetical protein